MSITARLWNAVNSVAQKLTENIEKDNGSYWEMSRSDDRIQDQSHWYGSRRWDNARWFDYGDFHYRLIEKCLRNYAEPEYFRTVKDKTALEWGCGGGANIRPLCEHFSSAYGIDVSSATLENCELQMKRIGLHNFIPVYISSEHPESVLDNVDSNVVDFILSVAVFQHFPSKDYSLRVLKVIEQLLKKDGFALIQTRYFDGSEKLMQKNHDYARNVVYMTSFTSEAFTEQVKEAGLTVLSSRKDIDNSEDCHEYFFVTK